MFPDGWKCNEEGSHTFKGKTTSKGSEQLRKQDFTEQPGPSSPEGGNFSSRLELKRKGSNTAEAELRSRQRELGLP